MTTWAEVRDEAVGTPEEVWRHGLAESQFDTIDRDVLVAVVPEGLDSGDWIAAVAARRIADPRLTGALETTHANGQGRFAAEVFAAIDAVGGDTSGATRSAIEALGKGHWSNRAEAARAARQLDYDDMLNPLLALVADDDQYLVRYHAAESLLCLARVEPPDIARHETVWVHLMAGKVEPPTPASLESNRLAAEALRLLLP